MKYKELEGVGLTKSEILVYTSLLKIGQSPTGKIVKEAKISSGKIYEILNKLIEKGLVSFVLKNNVKYFSASPPKQIKEYLDKKKKDFEISSKAIIDLIPELEEIGKGKKPDYKVEVHEGFGGFRASLFSFSESLKTNETVYSLGISGKRSESVNLIWNKFLITTKDKKIKHKIIVSDLSGESLELLKEFKLSFKSLPGFFMAPLMIGGDSLLIFNFDELSVISIRNKTIVNQFIFFFDSLWKIAR